MSGIVVEGEIVVVSNRLKSLSILVCTFSVKIREPMYGSKRMKVSRGDLIVFREVEMIEVMMGYSSKQVEWRAM